MNGTEAGQLRLAASYLLLRKAIGWIGTLLPVVLIAGEAALYSTTLPGSMSGYYYTPMRNVFVGALCVLGFFLVAYDSGAGADRRITNVAGVGALGVAFCPTKPVVAHLTRAQEVTGDFHLAFAVVAFVALGVMSLRFAKADSDGLAGSPPSRGAVVAYRSCGGFILACVALAAASNALPASVKGAWPLLFTFEALAVFAFGISWFVKGNALQPLASVPGLLLKRVARALSRRQPSGHG
jgi:hypothetical protein